MKPYFSHDEGARNDPKLVKVLMRLGQAGKGVYWDLVEMLYEQGGYLLMEECESYAYALRTECELIKRLVYEFDLFESDGTKFWSETCLVRMKMRDAKRLARAEAGAKGGKIKAEREAAAKALLEQDHSNASANPSNATAMPPEILASKEKESKGNTAKAVEAKPAAVVRRLPLPAEDVQLFDPAAWPGLCEPAKFAAICTQLGYPQVNAERYRQQILVSLADKQLPAVSLRNWIKTYLNNDEAAGKLMLQPVQVPNEVPGNWDTAKKGTYTAPMGQGIPHPSSYLKPEFLPR